MKQTSPASLNSPASGRRYSWPFLVLALLLAILLAACQQGAAPAPDTATSGTAQDGDAPAAGGELIVATNLEPDPTNPHNRTEANLAWYLAIYDTLTLYDDTLEPQPRLAESWE